MLCAFLAREYGWTIGYVESLPIDKANLYHDAAVSLKAKDRLHSLAVESYPHMKDKDRKKYKKLTDREANPVDLKPVMSAKDMAKKLGKTHGFGN